LVRYEVAVDDGIADVGDHGVPALKLILIRHLESPIDLHRNCRQYCARSLTCRDGALHIPLKATLGWASRCGHGKLRHALESQKGPR
jgi:hypothetical protein